MELCKSRRIMRIAIPARHDIPISIQSKVVTAIACSGPAHRKCKNIVTLKEKDKAFLGLHKNKTSKDTVQKQSALKEQRGLTEMISLSLKPAKAETQASIPNEEEEDVNFSHPTDKLQFSSGQSLGRVQVFATPWTAECQASLSITNSWSLRKLMSIESVMPSNHLILSHLLLFSPSIFPSIKGLSNQSALRIRWPKY